MLRRKTAGAALVALATAGTLVLSHSPAEADFSPQPKDVVATGSDIIQNSFNFLADGYHQLPGYNTAGNRYRFVSFDSSGDAQGRSGFTDPRLLPTITGDGSNGTVNGEKYVKQSDLRLLNPTISLRAGQDLVVRPSGGGAGGRDAIIADKVDGGIGGWIDVGRTPNELTAANQNLALSNLGTKLIRVQVATDRQLIATSTTTNAPATISALATLNIYSGLWTTWGDVSCGCTTHTGETIIPLILPTDAGMWGTFVTNVGKQNPGVTVNSGTLRANPTAITSLGAAARANAIVPFPRGRFNTLNTGYYAQTKESEGTLASPKTNLYNTEAGHRTAASAAGIQLLDPTSTQDVLSSSAPYGGNFPYNAVIRESDLTSNVPWQPGSTLNWVQALFYNPGGPDPFVRTPAGEALLEAAGVTPDYHVFGTDNAEIPVD
jgi:ABC-type phosphate transport system substrate-binding protein